jgi:hypothetical protein
VADVAEVAMTLAGAVVLAVAHGINFRNFLALRRVGII